MNIAVLLDYLQEELEAGSNMPFSQKTAVDSGKCLDLINDMRTTLPREITEAEGILNEKDNILYEAERKVEKIIAEAQEKAKSMVTEHSITQEAFKEAESIIQKADKGAASIRDSVNEYVEDVLAEMETYMKRQLDMLKQNRMQMRGH